LRGFINYLLRVVADLVEPMLNHLGIGFSKNIILVIFDHLPPASDLLHRPGEI